MLLYLWASQIVRENTEIEWNQTHRCRTHVYDGLSDAPNEGALATQTPSLWNPLLQQLRKLLQSSQIYGPKSNSSSFLDRLDEALHGFCDRTYKQGRCPEQLALGSYEATFQPEHTFSSVCHVSWRKFWYTWWYRHHSHPPQRKSSPIDTDVRLPIVPPS